jgi:hypothetical protein
VFMAIRAQMLRDKGKKAPRSASLMPTWSVLGVDGPIDQYEDV